MRLRAFHFTPLLGTVALTAAIALAPRPALAATADSTDFGDAPEGILAYPSGVIGHFPTCLAPSPAGTREAACAPLSSAPGPTGYMKHLPSLIGQRYWLGCGTIGIDFEPDGKVGAPPDGVSDCSGLPTDCVGGHSLWTPPMAFDQDECVGDADAGVAYDPLVDARCVPAGGLGFKVFNAAAAVNVYMNLLIDMNHDGDWNDNFDCGGCIYEWAVKNLPVTLPAGCSNLATPMITAVQAMQSGYFDATWLRVSLTDEPVDDDYPWNGSASRPDGAYHGGETEDYPSVLFAADPVRPTSWGRLKTIYR